MGRKTKTKLTFAVTMEKPSNMSIKEVRETLYDILVENSPQFKGINNCMVHLKINLLNKEIVYA